MHYYGTAALQKKKVRRSAMAGVNSSAKKSIMSSSASYESDLVPWDSNSCFIDSIAEFIQRAVLPLLIIDPNDEDDTIKMLGNWKNDIKFDGYVKGTQYIRDFFLGKLCQKKT
jgi:hypothetical protein